MKCLHMIAFHAVHIIGFGSSLCLNVHQVLFNEISMKFLIIQTVVTVSNILFSVQK